MAVRNAMLILLAFVVTSSASRDGDLLQSACSQACRDWEEWRKQCFNKNCQRHLVEGKDWFPCYLKCWNRSRACVARCADNFWTMYSTCSHQCFGRTGRKRWRCRHACVINSFAKIRKTIAPPFSRKRPLSRKRGGTSARRRAHMYM